jgi:hypothetical protein
MRTVKITVGSVELIATLRNTATADAIFKRLPLHSTAQTWGAEVYFAVPVEASLEPDAKQIVERGEIAFWVQGRCIAIGFGPTPASRGNEIRLATKTNIWADTRADLSRLKQVGDGEPVHVAAVD